MLYKTVSLKFKNNIIEYGSKLVMHEKTDAFNNILSISSVAYNAPLFPPVTSLGR